MFYCESKGVYGVGFLASIEGRIINLSKYVNHDYELPGISSTAIDELDYLIMNNDWGRKEDQWKEAFELNNKDMFKLLAKQGKYLEEISKMQNDILACAILEFYRNHETEVDQNIIKNISSMTLNTKVVYRLKPYLSDEDYNMLLDNAQDKPEDKTIKDPKFLSQQASSQDMLVRMEVASNENTPIDTIKYMSKNDNNPFVLEKIAMRGLFLEDMLDASTRDNEYDDDALTTFMRVYKAMLTSIKNNPVLMDTDTKQQVAETVFNKYKNARMDLRMYSLIASLASESLLREIAEHDNRNFHPHVAHYTKDATTLKILYKKACFLRHNALKFSSSHIYRGNIPEYANLGGYIAMNKNASNDVIQGLKEWDDMVINAILEGEGFEHVDSPTSAYHLLVDMKWNEMKDTCA